jgi:outer membrane protein assembly factor BamB
MARPTVIACWTILCTLLLAARLSAQPENWPQWRGPDRSGLSKETGLLKSWPEGGPKRLWMFENCGVGFGGPAIVDGRMYILGARDGEDLVLCLDANKGTEIWAASMGPALKNDWSDGSRGTPAVVDGHVYALSGSGTIICVRARDGGEVWRTTMQKIGGKTPFWGFSESVLVDNDRVICTPGGSQGSLAALDKHSGNVLWRTKEVTDDVHYASPIRAEINGQTQYVQLLVKHLVGVAPDDGRVLWQADFPGQTAVIPTPIVHGNKVFATAGYGVGCLLAEIAPDNSVKTVYQNKLMKNHHGGVIRVGDYLYGHSDPNGWLCMDFASGERKWVERQKFGKGAIAYADGMLYCLNESDGESNAEVALIEASPEGWKERGRFELQPQTEIRKQAGRVWTHPVVVGGRLYLRDQDKVYCYDVKGQ